VRVSCPEKFAALALVAGYGCDVLAQTASPIRSDDGREDASLPGERIVRGGNYIFDDTPDKLVAWNRTVAFRNPATGHRQIGFRCAATD
jgi:hypothetical protein